MTTEPLAEDPAPATVLDAGADGAWVVACDHASNAVPSWAPLGLPDAEMARHIAWDPGAAGVAAALGRRLRAPVLLAGFSRLVIDPNRGEDDPTLVMRLYDGTVVPGNRGVDRAEVERRLARLHRPYHAALAGLLAARPRAALLSVHSFTPQLRGRPPRPWHVAVLHSHRDGRLARPLLRRLGALGLAVGDNQPYGGHLPGDTVDRHALGTGRMNALVELRQDGIATEAAREGWADRLAPVLAAALEEAQGGMADG